MPTLPKEEIAKLALHAIQEKRSGRGDSHFRRLREQFRGYLKWQIWAKKFAFPDLSNVENEVWQLVWEQLEEFDPERGAFGGFLHTQFLAVFNEAKKVYKEEKFVLGPDGVDGIKASDSKNEEDEDWFIPWEMRSAAFRETFRISFRCGGYPYQVLAWGFSKLILGYEDSSKKNRGVPILVDKWVGGKKLRELIPLLATAYCDPLGELLPDFVSEAGAAGRKKRKLSPFRGLSLDEVQTMMEPTAARLSLKVEELFDPKVDPDSIEEYSRLFGRVVGETTLGDFYRDRFSEMISDWCYKVRKRVNRVFQLPGGMVKGVGKRCKLRRLPTFDHFCQEDCP